MMVKKKLTLSIREDLLNEIKMFALIEGRSLSDIVEEYFEYLIFSRWANTLGKELGLSGYMEPITEQEIPKNRIKVKGLDAASVVRELREERIQDVS
jgi:hypothetical protein